MHFLGLNGMPRRTFTYDGNMGWNEGNLVATIGAFILGIGVAIYFAVMVYTYFKGERVGIDPWDARTLEWSLPNPPPEYNFLVIPTVHTRDDWWYQKQHRAEVAQEQAQHLKEEVAHGGIHMPHQSIYPFIAGVGILIGGIGIAIVDADPGPGLIGRKLATVLVGFAILVTAVYLWSLEGNEGYHLHPEAEAGHGPRPEAPLIFLTPPPFPHEQHRSHRRHRPPLRPQHRRPAFRTRNSSCGRFWPRTACSSGA